MVSVMDKFWVECRLDLRRGLVPSVSVSPLALEVRPGQRLCVARAGFINSQGSQHIHLNKGEGNKTSVHKMRYSVSLLDESSDLRIPFLLLIEQGDLMGCRLETHITHIT